jgi:hypothetical protein
MPRDWMGSIRVSRVIVRRPRRTGFRKQAGARAAVLLTVIMQASSYACFQPRSGNRRLCPAGTPGTTPGDGCAPLVSRPNPNLCCLDFEFELLPTRWRLDDNSERVCGHL